MREALEAAVAWCERYPDIRSEALRDAIAGEKGIAPEDIVCGNGASELFPAILRAVHAKKVLLAVPSFYGYEHAAKSVGAEICCHELLEADGYAVTERFLTAIGEDVDAVFWQSRIIRWVRWWSRNCWRRLRSDVRRTA